jgi:uncharacterized RDD family membrane protein YckC
MEWYYLRDGKTMGPVPEGSIRAWLESGFLQPDDLLWRAGMKQWLPLAMLAEFGGPGEPEATDRPEPESWRQSGDDLDRGDAPTAGGETGAEPSTGATTIAGGQHSAETGADPRNTASAGAGFDRRGASSWGPPADWSESPVVYASIWARAGAAAVDLMLLVAAVLVIFRPDLPTTGNIEDMAKLNPAITPVFMALGWLYFALLEGSALQASLGKLAFGLRVADLDGHRLLLGRALMRGLLKVVLMEITASLSFLPAAFTARRQALHDIISGTIVLVR